MSQLECSNLVRHFYAKNMLLNCLDSNPIFYIADINVSGVTLNMLLNIVS